MLNDISTHIALKNPQNICKGIRVMEVFPILSSSAWVNRLMSTLKINSQVNVIKLQI